MRRFLNWIVSAFSPTTYNKCGAIDWAWGDRDLLGEDDEMYVIVFGVCDRPVGHDGQHREHRPDGSTWAEWSIDAGPIPDDVRITR